MAMPGPRMPSDDHDQDQDHEAEDRRAWVELGRFLALVAFVIALFFLAELMVHHHFFTGGAQDNRSAMGPTGSLRAISVIWGSCRREYRRAFRP